MPNFKTILELTVKAKTQSEATGAAEGAADHLFDTFNDDDSIKRIRWMSGGLVNIVVPADLLQKLIDGADLAGDERNCDAEALRRDGERETAKEAAGQAREYHKAVRAGLALLRGKTQTKPAPVRPAATKAELKRARAAYAMCSEDLQIDDDAVTSHGEGVTWVQAWVRIDPT